MIERTEQRDSKSKDAHRAHKQTKERKRERKREKTRERGWGRESGHLDKRQNNQSSTRLRKSEWVLGKEKLKKKTGSLFIGLGSTLPHLSVTQPRLPLSPPVQAQLLHPSPLRAEPEKLSSAPGSWCTYLSGLVRAPSLGQWCQRGDDGARAERAWWATGGGHGEGNGGVRWGEGAGVCQSVSGEPSVKKTKHTGTDKVGPKTKKVDLAWVLRSRTSSMRVSGWKRKREGEGMTETETCGNGSLCFHAQITRERLHKQSVFPWT